MNNEKAFDPFGDFETAGHLRNVRKDKDPSIIKAQEHNLFRTYLPDAYCFLKEQEDIRYEHFLEVHRILFGDYYPWAGRERSEFMPNTTVSKGRVRFAAGPNIRMAVEKGLELAENALHMRQRPGEIMGLFAYGHPFLDGNGRTMMIVFAEFCERAGFFVDWTKADTRDYLACLAREIQTPNDRAPDEFLRKLIVNDMHPGTPWHQRLGEIHMLAGMEADPVRYETGSGSAAETAAFEKARNYSLSKNGAEATGPQKPRLR